MHRDPRLYLDDILEAIHKIRDYTAGMEYTAFSKDTKTQDAVIRNLEIIGEAAGRLQEPVRVVSPDIEWRKNSGVAEYSDPRVLWREPSACMGCNPKQA